MRRGVLHRTPLAVAAGLLLGACATHRVPVGWQPPVGTVALGVASWYGPGFHGRKTSSGARFDQDGLTAAHRLWAFGTRVRVTLLSTGRSVEVTINDRIPRKDRIIDLSRGAARRIGLIGPGIGRVKIEVLGTEARKAWRGARALPRRAAAATSGRPAVGTGRARVLRAGTARAGGVLAPRAAPY